LFWKGVLPEAVGLCFVAVIFTGFAGAYLFARNTWEQQTADSRQTQTDRLARLIADTVGAGTPPETAQCLLRQLAQQPNIRSVQWTGPAGEVRFAWPAAGQTLPGPTPENTPPDTPAVAVANVRTPDGTPEGSLRVELAGDTVFAADAQLFWTWGIAACTTLIIFVLLYRRLRRHLRPLTALHQNLEHYAAGVERQLSALTLGDSLGATAKSWNLLVREFAAAQQQLEAAQRASQTGNILTRFESAVFRRIVDRLPFGALCVNSDQVVTYANDSALALLATPAEAVLGQALSAAVPAPAVLQAVSGTQARASAALSVDHTRIEGESEITLRFRVLPLSDDAAGGETLITIEDIGQLRETQRARDNFLYHVTHELRTPLTSIHAYAETLTRPGFDDEQTRKECYNVIISETRRLSALVEDILSLSQLEVGTARLDIGDVDLVRLIRQMVQDNLGAADEKRIDLTLTLPPKAPKVRGDKQRLSVLLMNLIGNAIKYTPENGTVQVALTADEQRVSIDIRDTGIGIAPQDQEHVFEKFYRASDDKVQAVAGTGLGLAIAHEVARLHGGDIHLQSEPGQGSTFTIELPVASNEPAEAFAR
jgi:signal transduction histidine kinase